MTDRSLLFSKPMILALAGNRKTKTRRLDVERWRDAPVGTRVWIREAWRTPKSLDAYSGKKIGEMALDAGYPKAWSPVKYEADGALNSQQEWRDFGSKPGEATSGRYRHGRFMPRWASRLTLIVKSVKVERLQDISDADAVAEGIRETEAPDKDGMRHFGIDGPGGLPTASRAFFELWTAINGAESYRANPWVAAISFRVVKANIDALCEEVAP